MVSIVEKWLDDILCQAIPDEVVAFNFNLYEDGGEKWSMELVGTDAYDPDDEDWRCEEVTDFGTREEPLSWTKATGWETVLEDAMNAVKQYLVQGQYADILKSKEAVGIGFVDGDGELLYPED